MDEINALLQCSSGEQWLELVEQEIARKLGETRLTAIEFGVAGGNGLVAMERHAEAIYKETGVSYDVVGFDTGTGLPPVGDFRDHPYLWEEGEFIMEIPKLRARLKRADVIIGRLENTLQTFLERDSAPIGFIAFNLDLYTSTRAAFKVYDASLDRLMPRVFCYFDDILASIELGYTHFAGELLAIKEFNEEHGQRKIDSGIGISKKEYSDWQDQLFTAHLFDHPKYNQINNDSANLELKI